METLQSEVLMHNAKMTKVYDSEGALIKIIIDYSNGNEKKEIELKRNYDTDIPGEYQYDDFFSLKADTI